VLFIVTAMIPHKAFLIPPAANMADYTAYPPFVTESAPPLVMLAMGRDHKIYYEAYNDASDLDEDGRLDVGYKHTIDYYGYFDPYKCYTYSGSGATAKFDPVSTTANKYCSGQWSGNFLNWLSMSRMDVIKKVFYGGYRSTDSGSETVLEGAYIPQDAHSWGKEYAGSDTDQLTPFSDPAANTRHLFCVTSLSDGDPHRIRVLQGRSERMWQWASVERPVCSTRIDTNNNGNASDDPVVAPADYYVRVKVCDPSAGLESNCRYYPGGGGVYKPQGLLQKYGEGDGSKVCSKTYTKACNTNSDCTLATEGICIDKVQIYFGLMTGSYTNNLSGGVLRKNTWSFLDETNSNTGIFQTSENVEGNIVLTLDRMKTVGFRYSDYSYQDASGGNCGWITTRALNESECRMWGNPMAEIMYESIRYFADLGSPTSDFMYGTNADAGLNLPKLGTGPKPWIQPYSVYPACSKPFILTFSDINPSYDSDKVPGSYFNSFTGDLPGMNVSNLVNTIGTNESIAGNNWFIGQSGNTYDFICSSKNVSNLSSIRGLCPEEPTKQGSYYSAAVAYYGKTMMMTQTGKPNINTYSVALASPVPDIKVKVGNNFVKIVPTGKSVDGCLSVRPSCNDLCTLTTNADGLHISNCAANAYCPSNQIVDFYVDTITYDALNNITYAKFQINYEDVEQGADHDMDAIATYEIQSAGANQIQVTLTTTYAAGCIGQVLGFVVSGTTADGLYLPIRDTDGNWNGVAGGLPTTWTKTFTASGTTAGTLTDPLKYAAKWGGFEDFNNSGTPDNAAEWDSDGNGDPDTYFLVVNPLKLEQQLEKAFADILRRAASGTAVAVTAAQGEGEGAVYQAYFFPKKLEGVEDRKWLGYIHGLFVDGYGNLREDTDGDKTLTLAADNIVRTRFDPTIGTVVDRYKKICSLNAAKSCNTNSDCNLATEGTCTELQVLPSVKLEDISSIWNGGKKLWATDHTVRKIYTTIDGSSYGGLVDIPAKGTFNDSNATALRQYLRAIDDPEAANIINYIRGQDIAGYRKRTITVGGQTHVWKLGDIVYSTPTAVSKPMENYDLLYGDPTYSQFRQAYLNRRHVVYVGANDGMLHAFNAGFYDYNTHKFWRGYSGAAYSDPPASPEIGDELWAFIPRELLPHLKWLTDPNYTHVYYVDLKPKITDVKIFTPDAVHTNGWGTILIGGMRYGGKTIPTELGDISASYFCLDITDPMTPRLLWTFTTSDLGLTMSYPAVSKVGNEWYVMFGSGPTSFDALSNLTAFQNGQVFVAKISGGVNGVISSWTQGTNFWKFATGHSNAFLSNPITVDANTDYSVDVAYIGENYKQGLNKRAAMWRLTTSAWTLSELYNVDSGDDLSKRLTASPSASIDKKGRLWVYFGTGQFLGVGDRNISDTGAFYGIRDSCWDGSCTTTYQTNNILNVTNAVVPIGGSNITGLAGGPYNWTQLMTLMETKDGWATYFKDIVATTDFMGRTMQHQGERVTTKPVILGGLVLFATYVPGGDICSISGTSNLYVLYYESGTAYKDYVFKREKTLGTPTVSGAVRLGDAMPASVGIAITREGKVQGFVQSSTGEIQTIEEIAPKAPRSGYTGWKAGGVGGCQ